MISADRAFHHNSSNNNNNNRTYILSVRRIRSDNSYNYLVRIEMDR
jgi:hypothetical protein